MVMKLESIGFYTLSDARAQKASSQSPLMRCELLVTSACTFKCPYCRPILGDYAGTLPIEEANKTLDYWISEGLVNVRFSGGEPTLHKRLTDMVCRCVQGGVKRIALSTNGAATQERYQELLDAGINDFSVSLDACCSSTGDTMAGVVGQYQRVIDSIRFLSKHSYVTVGIVLTEQNVKEAVKTIELASELGASDIRVIPAAQWNQSLTLDVRPELLAKHPILRYKLAQLNEGKTGRGLCSTDNNRCPLVLDDMAVVKDSHFPCIIYLRERGKPIGKIGSDTRKDRERWAKEHDTHADPICKTNCLSFCSDYNNKHREFNR
jgi:MoaA/NifB/PqqE/SkfB family radical SAM enzyme